MTLVTWLDMWYTTYVETSDLAPSTKAMYRRAIAAVPAELGQHDLTEQLLPLHLYRWLTSVSKVHPRAAQLDRVMLSRALRLAHKLGLAPQLTFDADTVPKTAHKPKETAVLTSAQVVEYLRHAKASPCYPLLALCLCGLRRGEALGARWQDLDGDVLHIKRQRQRHDGALVTRQLKSSKARRSLRLPVWLVEDIRSWPRTITGWIVDTTPDRLHKEHRKVIEAAQLPMVTLHGLRHTFATMAAAQGLPMKHLQLAMGHSKLQLTADLYADHLDPLSDLPALVWTAF